MIVNPHLLYLPVRAPSAPPASVLKCGVSPRAPGATERPSLGEVVLRPLTAPSRLLSPRLGDLSARHASATAAWRSVNIKYSILQLHVLCIYTGTSHRKSVLTCDWSVILVKVDPDAPPLSSAHSTSASTTQRYRHHTVNVG